LNIPVSRPLVTGLIWLVIATTLGVVAWQKILEGTLAWDAVIYQHTIIQVHSGQSPYITDFAMMERARAQNIRFASLYSPLTMAFFGLLGSLPVWLYGSLYWLLYAACALAPLWAMRFLLLPNERVYASILAPLCILFPGLLYTDTILTGNVAYVMYGVALAAAVIGWRKNRWIWFYLAVLLASCTKPHLLTLLAIPVFSARRQWLGSVLAGFTGAAIFFSQAWIMPKMFAAYLQSMDVFMRYPSNRDNGFSPTEALGEVLKFYGISFKLPCLIFYITYSVVILLVLLWFSQRYKAGQLTFSAWAPSMLLGVILLDPRIMQYDVAPVTIPLAVIIWRFFAARGWSRKWTLSASLAFLLIANLAVVFLDALNLNSKLTELPIMLGVFIAGVIVLKKQLEEPAT